MYGIRKDLYNDMLSVIKNSNVKKAILFGSRARNEYKSNSDIDLAFIFNNNDKDNFIKMQAKLEELNTLYKFDIVDLKSLKDSRFKEEILKDGIVIFDK